jgi:hypothetical protein
MTDKGRRVLSKVKRFAPPEQYLQRRRYALRTLNVVSEILVIMRLMRLAADGRSSRAA